jgi:hypothetical protein
VEIRWEETAAKLAGLPNPEFFLSNNGGLFVLRRFDIKDDGSTHRLEDTCSLQALPETLTSELLLSGKV